MTIYPKMFFNFPSFCQPPTCCNLPRQSRQWEQSKGYPWQLFVSCLSAVATPPPPAWFLVAIFWFIILRGLKSPPGCVHCTPACRSARPLFCRLHWEKLNWGYISSWLAAHAHPKHRASHDILAFHHHGSFGHFPLHCLCLLQILDLQLFLSPSRWFDLQLSQSASRCLISSCFYLLLVALISSCLHLLLAGLISSCLYLPLSVFPAIAICFSLPWSPAVSISFSLLLSPAVSISRCLLSRCLLLPLSPSPAVSISAPVCISRCLYLPMSLSPAVSISRCIYFAPILSHAACLYPLLLLKILVLPYSLLVLPVPVTFLLLYSTFYCLHFYHFFFL